MKNPNRQDQKEGGMDGTVLLVTGYNMRLGDAVK
jgi:hypothetical protein